MGVGEVRHGTPGYRPEKRLVKVPVTGDSHEVTRSVASLNRRWWSIGRRNYSPPELVATRYYPYYFQSWKVTAPKTLGRTARMILFTGVNGMNRSVGPATGWPAGEEVEVVAEEVIPAHTSEAEAEQLAQEYIEKFVMRRYRPSRTAEIVREEFELVYVPYYVYAREGQPLQRAALIEGFTGAVGRIKDVPAVLRSVVGEGVANKGKVR